MQLGQRRREHLLVLARIMWTTKGAPHREIHEYGARCSRALHDVAHRTDDDCRDAARLDSVRDETHGLVAEGSIRHQDREINTQCLQLIHKSRCQLLLDLLLDLGPAHERDEHRSDAADYALLSKFG